MKFQLGRYQEAIGDFDSALAINERFAQAAYLRGLSKLKLGDEAGGNADIATAKTLAPAVVEGMVREGLVP